MSTVSYTPKELQTIAHVTGMWETIVKKLADIDAWPRDGALHIESEVSPGYLGWVGYDEGGEIAFSPNEEVPEPEVPIEEQTWEVLEEVPYDVAVYSKGGVYWSYWDKDRKDDDGATVTTRTQGEWLYSSTKSKGGADYGPGYKKGPFTFAARVTR